MLRSMVRIQDELRGFSKLTTSKEVKWRTVMCTSFLFIAPVQILIDQTSYIVSSKCKKWAKVLCLFNVYFYTIIHTIKPKNNSR